MAAVTQEYGSYTALTLTSLASLASSATAGWISAIIDNRTTKAQGYSVLCTFPMANTAAANDKAVYVFAVPCMHNGSAWVLADGGTTTLPTEGPATYTFGGITTTNNFVLCGALAYTATDQTVQGIVGVPAVSNGMLYDGVALFILNYSGAAFEASGQVIAYRALSFSVA